MSTTNWRHGVLLGFDLETSGVDPLTDRIVTASLVLTNDGVVVDRRTLLANPGIPIPEGARKVHGISDETAAHGLDPAHVVRTVVDAITTSAVDAVVGYNLSYDLTMLQAEATRNGIDGDLLDMLPPVIDAMVLDRALDRYRRGPRHLTDVAALYGVTLDRAHTADADAEAAVLVARAIAEKYPQARIPVDALHQRQVGWRAEQCASLQTYLRRTKNDPSIVVDGAWPIHARPDDDAYAEEARRAAGDTTTPRSV